MALSQSVEESLKEAEGALRNALAYAARQEKPFVAKHIADMVMEIDNLIKADQLMDKLEDRMNGKGDDKGMFGTFFG
jgi:chromosomal replication initiation ATPase DnaA